MQHLFELNEETIITLLKYSAWSTPEQSLSSASTNGYCPPEPVVALLELGENTSGVDAFADINLGKATRILDVGGGKFDATKNYLAKKGIKLLVWDPFNRSQVDNFSVQKEVTQHKVSLTTSMSVLNVIPEITARLAHICTVRESLALGGQAYFKIWTGEGKLKNSFLPSVDQNSFQANAHAVRFLREIQMVFGEKNVVLHPTIPNLLVAHKKAQMLPSLKTIKKLQFLSKQDLHYHDKQRALFFAKETGQTFFIKEACFFRQAIKNYFYEEKLNSLARKGEPDRRLALIQYASGLGNPK